MDIGLHQLSMPFEEERNRDRKRRRRAEVVFEDGAVLHVERPDRDLKTVMSM
jgi:hypothetical protein